MFGHLGIGEVMLLAVVGMLVVGPERLPKVAKDAAAMLRQLRRMANDAKRDLKAELGPELGDLPIRSLNPRTIVRDMLLDDTPAPARTAAPQSPTPQTDNAEN